MRPTIERSLPPYLAALRSAGATPILVPLHERQDRVARLLAGVQGILLPGCRFDVDPQRYGQERIAECGEPDPARTAVDELLLQEAFSLRKPILAICHGTQSLNVWLQRVADSGSEDRRRSPARAGGGRGAFGADCAGFAALRAGSSRE